MMGLLQKLSVAFQLAALLGAEVSKLATPGANVTIPPEGLPGVQVKTQDADYELRIVVKRTR